MTGQEVVAQAEAGRPRGVQGVAGRQAVAQVVAAQVVAAQDFEREGLYLAVLNQKYQVSCGRKLE